MSSITWADGTDAAMLWIELLIMHFHALTTLAQARLIRTMLSPNWIDTDGVNPPGATTFDTGPIGAGVGFVATEGIVIRSLALEVCADIEEVIVGAAMGMLETVVPIVAFTDRDPPVESMNRLTLWTLTHLQQWLTAKLFARSWLVVPTLGPIAADSDEAMADLGAAAVWSSVRPAQSENLDRIAVIDIDSCPDLDPALLTTPPETGEHQPVARGQTICAARMAQMVVKSTVGGTVVVTGGAGGLGRVVTRHLVVEHDVWEPLSLSNPGLRAEGASELVEGRLQDAAGPALSTTPVFGYCSPDCLGEHLSNDTVPTETPMLVVSYWDPLVIEGIACRLPDEVDSSEQAWDLVDATGGDGIRPFRSDRGWGLDRLPGPTRGGSFSTQLGGFLFEADTPVLAGARQDTRYWAGPFGMVSPLPPPVLVNHVAPHLPFARSVGKNVPIWRLLLRSRLSWRADHSTYRIS
ncbi:beta-ketoacyl synthase N-terminal-like domain-containing protein [Nocardia amikacinitolerans]|uniref:SpnB-like Rossmann fold domain-containing protein n=1 Tax=Nocardia amikacinitolerans TaxID=756689 RepID=UPI0036975391